MNSECFNKRNGEYIEGYLSDIDFNGVLFLLREANDRGKQVESFWFRKIYRNRVYNEPIEWILEANEKRTASKFINRFSEMLDFIGMDKGSLKSSAFANVHINKNVIMNTATLSTEYKRNKEIIKNADKKIKGCNAKIVFTCSDVFSGLVEYYGVPQEEVFVGVTYAEKEMRRIRIDEEVDIYEIVHPSRSKRLLKGRKDMTKYIK